jgi:hypothetical protein
MLLTFRAGLAHPKLSRKADSTQQTASAQLARHHALQAGTLGIASANTSL